MKCNIWWRSGIKKYEALLKNKYYTGRKDCEIPLLMVNIPILLVSSLFFILILIPIYWFPSNINVPWDLIFKTLFHKFLILDCTEKDCNIERCSSQPLKCPRWCHFLLFTILSCPLSPCIRPHSKWQKWECVSSETRW